MTRISVVVPAHDEEALLPVALRHLLDVPREQVDLIVVANGCTDGTAARAREFGAAVRVLEIPEASKIKALNAGSRAVDAYPVAFVDADVSVAGSDLLALAELLTSTGAEVASPTLRVLPSRSWWVRQYYRVWALTDYRTSGHIGSGIYMLSEAGRARFDEFPDVIADDLFVQRLFAPEERCVADTLTFSVTAPGSLATLVRRNTRIAAGNSQIARVFPDLAPPPPSAGARSLVRRVARRPWLWPGFVVYSVVHVVTHRRARRLTADDRPISWNRDETTRKGSS